MPKWKVCIDRPFSNCERIYPIQQRKIRALIDYLSGNSNVELITVFGSSVTNMCHIDSDVDIYVKLNKPEGNLVHKYFDFVFDLWTNYTVDDRLKYEISKKGVIVYERNSSG